MFAIRLITLFFIFVATIVVGNCFAQQQPISKPDFGSGPLEEVADLMEDLLRLEWKGVNIALKHDWDEREEKKAEEEEDWEDEIEKLSERGFSEAQAREILERREGASFLGRKRSGVDKAFCVIPSGFGGSASSSGSSKTEQRQITFRNKRFSGSAFLAERDVHFSFTEHEASERNFEFRDNANGKLRFTFSCDQLLIRLIQNEKGNTQMVWIDGDKANVYVGNTFSDFVKDNQQAANEILYPLFERLGIQMPMDKTDLRVLNSALAKLEQLQKPDDEEVRLLIKELDADTYKAREIASEKLTEGFDRWSIQIEKSLKDKSLSREAHVRLKEIMTDNVKNAMDKFLTDQKLLESPEFLIGLFGVATDKQKELVAEQLEKVTNQNYGTVLEAWEKWLSTSATK